MEKYLELKKRHELKKLLIWFEWYDKQVIQYLRSRRQGVKWTVTKDDVLIESIEQLDDLAKQKASEIRDLKSTIKDLINQRKEKQATNPEEF